MDQRHHIVLDSTPPPAWKKFQTQTPLWGYILVYALAPVVYFLIAWGVYAIGSLDRRLYWVVMPTLGVFVFLCIGVIFVAIRFHIKRTDTATQTLRSASQGRVELIGTLKPLDEPVVSPLYGISCVAWWFTLMATPRQWPEGQSRPADLSIRESHMPAAVLLTDGENDAFLPFDNMFRDDTQVMLNKLDAPHDLMRQDLRILTQEEEWKITHRSEDLIPCDKPLQLNCVFRTLSSRDSYLEACYDQTNFLPPTPQELENSPLEQAWRAYCACREAAAEKQSGIGGPMRVDAILPITSLKPISLVRPVDAGGMAAWRIIHSMVLALLPAVYALLRLSDIIPPLLFLF